jgi:tetratricopeptide (TPR) repeat protein
MNLPKWLRRILAMEALGEDGSPLQREEYVPASLRTSPRVVLSLQSADEMPDRARAATSASGWNRAADSSGRVDVADPDNSDALIVTKKTPDVGALESAARECQTRKEYDRSIPLWTRLNELRPDRWEYALDLALDLRGAGSIGVAEDAFHRAVERHPNSFWVLFNWALTALCDHRLDAAEQRARKLLDRFPNERPAFELLGDIAFARRDVRAAESHFDAACSREPEHTGVREKLARARRYRQLSERFPPVLLQPTEFRAHANYAVLVINLDHNVDRFAQCQRAFANSPLPLYRVPGIRGRYLPAVAAHRLGGNSGNKGALGGLLAHAAAWEAMLDLKLERCLIVEDDAAPVINLPGEISALGIPSDFELCFVNERMQWQQTVETRDGLPAEFRAVDPVQALASWPSTHGAPGADGYFLSAGGARKLLSWFARDGFQGFVDWRLICYAAPRGAHTRFAKDSAAFREVRLFDRLGPGRLMAYSLFPCLIRVADLGSVLAEENAEGRRPRATAIW